MSAGDELRDLYDFVKANYADAELRAVHDLVADAAEGDPGEANEPARRKIIVTLDWREIRQSTPYRLGITFANDERSRAAFESTLADALRKVTTADVDVHATRDYFRYGVLVEGADYPAYPDEPFDVQSLVESVTDAVIREGDFWRE